MIAFAAMKPVQSDRSGFSKTFYLILIGILLLTNMFLFYYQYKKGKEVQQVTVQNEEYKAEINQLQTDYDSTIVEFEALKQDKTALTDEMVVLRDEVTAKQAEIDKLFNKGALNKRELSEARSLVSSLRSQANNYSAQLEQLRQANQKLSQENRELKEEVVVQQAMNEGLQEEKNQLEETVNNELATTKEAKEQLEDKISSASFIIGENLKAKGIRYKNNNQPVETDNTKKVERLEVCFDLLPNPVIDKDEQTIYLRIINPEGATLNVSSSGSGQMELESTGEMVPYSVKKTVPYKTVSRQNHCIYWEQDNEYPAGVYKAQIYNDGRKLTESTFELKKKLL